MLGAPGGASRGRLPLIDRLTYAVHPDGRPAERLVLEITETTIMSDPARTQRVLARLTAAGVRFAIDDCQPAQRGATRPDH